MATRFCDYNNFLCGHLHKKMRHSYAKFSDFVDIDDCIGKITLKSIRLQPVFVEKKIVFVFQTGKKYYIQTVAY